MATYIELQKQIEALQKEAEALKTEEREGVIERMKEAIAVYDISARELGFGGGRGQAAGGPGRGRGARGAGGGARSGAGGAAYSDDSGNTWGGRGPRPKWLKDALAGGARLEDFAVNRAK